MEWIEVTGRTVDEAKERALDELGVHESELEFELIGEARSGFLGIGRSEARIRARIKPLSREKPADKRRRRRQEGRSEGGEGSGGKRSPTPPPRRGARGTVGDAPCRKAAKAARRCRRSRRPGRAGRTEVRRGGSVGTETSIAIPFAAPAFEASAGIHQ